MTQRLPITAVVGSRNEAHLLGRCLPALDFCEERIVIDIDSTDATASVAERYGARVVHSPYVPIVERARISAVAEARHDWLLFTDPDEVIPEALALSLARLLPGLSADVAVVWAPIRFHVGARPLHGTIWGGENRRRLLVYRSGVDLSATVFGGTHPRPGFRTIELPFTEETAIRHFWVAGYRDWIRKHRRYLALQSRDRVSAGEITGFRACLATPWRAFNECYVRRHGYRDGTTGLVLSVLWALFSAASEWALLVELRRRGVSGAGRTP